jgi:16S rRNA (cytosine967-C5)-methyltransferase
MMDKPIKSSQQVVTALLLVGLYQLLEMRVPEHAAVSETVKSVNTLGKRWAKGLVNALLRRFQRERNELLEELEANESARLDLPQWLINRVGHHWPEQLESITSAWTWRPPMSLRSNSSRVSRSEYLARLEENGFVGRPSGIARNGIVLDKPCPVTDLPGFADGLVSVQDCGAQLAAELLSPQKGEKILDACAAPGGKTTHLLELQPDSHVTAADISEERLARVRENLDRLSLDAELVVADAAKAADVWQPQSFDRVLLDVPCSATGVIRRHPDIRMLRRDSDIDKLVILQREILDAAWTLVKPGGRLLYATCSVLAEENQQQVNRFLEQDDDAVEIPVSVDGAIPVNPGFQLLPVDETTDGFYYALLERRV